jgi:CBS domain containing-hemolysin-like protein
MALHDFASTFEVEPDSRDVVTVSGYVIHLLGRVPERGAGIRIGGWSGVVEVLDGRRVKTLRIRRMADGREEST